MGLFAAAGLYLIMAIVILLLPCRDKKAELQYEYFHLIHRMKAEIHLEAELELSVIYDESNEDTGPNKWDQTGDINQKKL